jgi:hypothetical protein
MSPDSSVTISPTVHLVSTAFNLHPLRDYIKQLVVEEQLVVPAAPQMLLRERPEPLALSTVKHGSRTVLP